MCYCTLVLLVLSLFKLIVQTNSRWYFKREYKNVLRLGVGLYLVSKYASLQFCDQMFIYCATNELLTEAVVIRDGRTAARRDSFVNATNQKQRQFSILVVMVHSCMVSFHIIICIECRVYSYIRYSEMLGAPLPLEVLRVRN